MGSPPSLGLAIRRITSLPTLHARKVKESNPRAHTRPGFQDQLRTAAHYLPFVSVVLTVRNSATASTTDRGGTTRNRTLFFGVRTRCIAINASVPRERCEPSREPGVVSLTVK